jgi:hypothetical protein
MAGGDAKYVEKPVPLTVLDALRVVKAPAAGVVPPIAGGDAKAAPATVPENVATPVNVGAARGALRFNCV